MWQRRTNCLPSIVSFIRGPLKYLFYFRWTTVAKETFKASKLPFDESKLDKVAAHLLEMYKTSACWQHCYGIPGLLTYIKSKNIPLGIISNFDSRLDTILTNLRLRDYFKFAIGSYEVRYSSLFAIP